MAMIDSSLLLDPYSTINGGTPTLITSSAPSAYEIDLSGATTVPLLTGGTPAAVSTFLNYGQNIGRSGVLFGIDPGAVGDGGVDPFVNINISTLFVGAGASLTISLQYAPDNGTGARTWTTAASTAAIPVANLTAGQFYQLPLPPVPPQIAGNVRFVRLNYTVSSGPFSAGAISSCITIGALTTKQGLNAVDNYGTWIS